MFNPLSFLKGGTSTSGRAMKRRAGRRARQGIAGVQYEQRQYQQGRKPKTIWQQIKNNFK